MESEQPTQLETNQVEREFYPRIILTKSFAHHMTECYNEYMSWLLNTYGHEQHQFGIDLLNIHKDDVMVIFDLHKHFFKQQDEQQSTAI